MAFKTLPILRGFTEIKSLYNLVTPLNGIICGGYARYVCSPNVKPVPSDDVDIYCKTELAFDEIKAILALEQFHVAFESEMSISYKLNKSDKWKAMPEINLIKPVLIYRIVSVGEAETILENFDFTVSRAAIISENECLVDEEFEQDETTKKIRIKNIHCPISSAIRCMKYTKKGYYVSATETLKLFIDWDARDDEYRSNLASLLAKAGTYDKESPENTGLTDEERLLLYRMMKID